MTRGRCVDAFAGIPALYIADGHHRAASAARARAAVGAGRRQRRRPSDTFIAVAFPDNQMQILPYNRTVKDLAGRTPEAFLAALRQRFAVTRRAGRRRARKGDVSMYLGRTLVHDRPLSARKPADDSRASSLDVALLQHHVLEPLLGIGDVRTDKRIDFVGGVRGTAALEEAVELRQGGRRVLDVPGDDRRSDGDLRRGRDHAAEVHVVRAEAARRPADPRI